GGIRLSHAGPEVQRFVEARQRLVPEQVWTPLLGPKATRTRGLVDEVRRLHGHVATEGHWHGDHDVAETLERRVEGRAHPIERRRIWGRRCILSRRRILNRPRWWRGQIARVSRE